MADINVNLQEYIDTLRGVAGDLAIRGDFATAGLLTGAARLISELAPKPPADEAKGPAPP